MGSPPASSSTSHSNYDPNCCAMPPGVARTWLFPLKRNVEGNLSDSGDVKVTGLEVNVSDSGDVEVAGFDGDVKIIKNREISKKSSGFSSITRPTLPTYDSSLSFDDRSNLPLITSKKSSGFGSITPQTLPTHDSSLSFDDRPDLPLILGMERTLFAALNNAWLLSIGGMGLMSVGSGDTRATHAGMGIMLGGVVNAFTAFGMHYLRVRQLKENRPCKYSHTLVWTAIVAMMSICALILELYFGVLYPYLNREKAVTIAN